MKYYDPRADVLFKKIFGRNEDLTISFLNAMLPLEDDEKIVSVDYLQPEVLPQIPDLKDSIVDVLCTDQKKRTFIVEMQMYWTSYFKQRVLFNASKIYSSQLKKGMNYKTLQPVYGLNLVNDIFDDNSEDFYHHYKMCEPLHPEKTINGIELFFFELPKFQPKNFSEKKMQVLWLKFLTEIDEHTVDVDKDLLENAEISKALDICTYLTQEEILGYDRYWDAISTAKTLASGKYDAGLKKGRAEGRAEGRLEGEKIGIEKGRAEGIEQGRTEQLVESIKNLMSSGFDFDKAVEALKVPLDQIHELRHLIFNN